jgi:hypothetical protein
MEGEGDDERASLVVLNGGGLKMRGSGRVSLEARRRMI